MLLGHCYHYDSLVQVPWDLQKYYHQRHRIFSRYDEGVWMTDDAWYGVTPEPIANKIAKVLSERAHSHEEMLVDCFAGVGGNSIAFALSGRWAKVFAIEKDSATLECAKHNAEIYGVADRISWHLGDCFELLNGELQHLNHEGIAFFASPPWGGPGYLSDHIFNLATMQPYNLDFLVSRLRACPRRRLVLYLPRTSDIGQLSQYCTGSKKAEVIHFCMEGSSKAICFFLDSE